MSNELKHMRKDVNEIKTDLKDMKKYLDTHFVTKTEFNPIQKFVIGIVTFILLAFMGAVAGIVFIQGGI